MSILDRPAVERVRTALRECGIVGAVTVLDDSSRTAAAAAAALGVEVGQIASSLVFVQPSGEPLLVITSGRHRVDPTLVSGALGLATLGRADADFVKAHSGFSIGGVSPVGWAGISPRAVIDLALAQYDAVWAAGGHPHAVFPTTFDELRRAAAATPVRVANDDVAPDLLT